MSSFTPEERAFFETFRGQTCVICGEPLVREDNVEELIDVQDVDRFALPDVPGFTYRPHGDATGWLHARHGRVSRTYDGETGMLLGDT